MNHYTDPHQRKLLKRWETILESGSTPIQDQQTKVVLAQVLENTHEYYTRQGMVNEAGISQADIIGKKQNGYMRGQDNYPYRDGAEKMGDFYLPNVVMPMLRRIMPDLIANELVSVQPLNGPVGFALAFRPVYGKFGQFLTANTEIDGREIFYNPVDTRFTGKEGGLTAFGEKLTGDAEAAWTDYAGTSTNNPFLGEGAGVSEHEWATLGTDYPEVSFNLTKSTVEAKTRKLAAHWSPELAEDMQAMHGIDVEKEMVNTITYEVGAEIDRQIVSEMVKAALVGGKIAKWNPASADGLDQMGRLATLLTQITIEANNIAIRTKRGNANFVITTPRICALLEQLGMNKFTSFKNGAAMPSVPDTGVGALAKIGLINNDQQLLIRDASIQSASKDYVLMGYKGKNVGDSGIIYCPYIPLTLQKLMQPGTFSYSIGARTRYGVMNNPFEAKNYYTFMKIEGMYTAEGYALNGNRYFIGQPTDFALNGWNGGSPVLPDAYAAN